MIRTGCFGIPGRYGGKVHVVSEGKPICGTRIDPRARFQWCANHLVRSYVDCERCEKQLKTAPKWL